MKRCTRKIAVAWALAACLATAGEGERVRGVAYSSTNQPVAMDDPSDSFLADADRTEDGTPRTYDGTGGYVLRQGARIDDKLKFRGTDYVHWVALGAVLRAEGQCHDADPKETTRVSSQAWGAQVVEAKVSQEEGSFGTIRAENRIGFSYAYNVSGSRILEATVQLNGTCVDIDGRSHRFSLSDTRSESVSESLREVRVRGVKIALGAKASESTGRADGGTDSDAAAAVEFRADDTIDMTITRSLPEAGGDSGGASGPFVEDEVTGATPLEKSYSVYSVGSVVLAARGDKTESGDGTTHVFLEHFVIENVLRVFKLVDADPAPPPGSGPGGGGGAPEPDPEPGTGGPATGGPATGGEDGEAEALPGGDPVPEPESPTPDTPEDPDESDAPERSERSSASMSLDGLAGLDGIRVVARSRAPFGLEGEPGGCAGEFGLALDAPAPRDLVFAVTVDPPGALEHPCGSTITIPAGRRGAGAPIGEARLPVDCTGTGSDAFVSLHLLDEDGFPSGRELALYVPLVSIHACPAPRLYACGDADAWLPGADAVVRGIRGRRAPDLLIGRLGFGAFATDATIVTLEVEDPLGVLTDVPAVVEIAAGESETRVPLLLNDVEGVATIHVSSGAESLDVHVVARTQGWSSVPVLRVPRGASAALPYRLRWPEVDPRAVRAAVAEGSSAAVLAGDESGSLPSGVVLWAARIVGRKLGRTTVRLESEGLAPLDVPVEVTEPRVRLSSDAIELRGLPVGTSGTIRIRAPVAVVFRRVSMPPELAESILVAGAGTDTLVLTIRPCPDAPAVLRMPAEFDGPLAGPRVFDVLEQLEEDEPRPWRNDYQVTAE